MIDCIEKGVTTRQLILVVALDEPTAALDPIAENEIYSRFNSFEQTRRPFTFRIGCPAASRYHRRIWSRKAGGKRHAYSAFGCRRPICSAVERAGKVLCVACSSTTMPLPAKTKKWRKKQKAAAVLLTSVQKCDLIYTERFGIVKTAGARTKQLQIAK